MWVRSLITSPADGGVADGQLEVRGVAWSGHGPIAAVDVRIDDGEWFAAELGPQEGQHAPAAWSASISLEPGEHSIAARATDEVGDTQPESVPWNTRGYANNAVHKVTVTAR